MINAYSKRQFAQSDFDRAGYTFLEEEGIFIGTIDCKCWGKKSYLIIYFTLEDSRKILTCAWQRENYLGLKEAPFGSVMQLTFKKARNGLVYLRKAEPIAP